MSKTVSITTDDASSPVIDVPVSATVVEGASLSATEFGAVLFSSPCSECHSVPAGTLTGRELWDAVCVMCHEEGSVAPLQLSADTDARELERAIAEGRDGTGMPAYADHRGGPLSAEQVTGLVEFMRSE